LLKYRHITHNRQHEAVAGLPASALPANSVLADLGAKSPSIELLQKVRLTGPWVSLQMIADQSTWCNTRWSDVNHASNVRLFSMSSGPFWTGLAWSCSQICNLEFLRDQQRSIIQKMGYLLDATNPKM
jgi:hypothetical protein